MVVPSVPVHYKEFLQSVPYLIRRESSLPAVIVVGTGIAGYRYKLIPVVLLNLFLPQNLNL